MDAEFLGTDKFIIAGAFLIWLRLALSSISLAESCAKAAFKFRRQPRNVEHHDPSIDYYLSQVRHRKKGNDADGRLPVFLRVHRLRHQTPARARRLLRLLLLWVRALSANAGQTRVHFSERHHQQCLSLALSG